MKVLFSIHKGESIAHVLRINEILTNTLDFDFTPYIASTKGVVDYFNNQQIHFYESNQRYSFGAINNFNKLQKLFNIHAKNESIIYEKIQADLIIGDTGLISHSYNHTDNFYKILNRFYLEIGDKCYSPFSSEQKSAIRQDFENLVNNAREHLGYKKDFTYDQFCSKNVIVNGAYNFIHDIDNDSYLFSGVTAKLKPDTEAHTKNKNVCFVSLGTGDNGEKSKDLKIVLQNAINHFSKIYVSIGDIKTDLEFLSSSKIVAKKRYSKLPSDVGVLIIHGGCGVSHLAFQARIPAILLPRHVEQYSNAYILEKSQLGKSIGYIPDNDFMGLSQKIVLKYDEIEECIIWAKESYKETNAIVNYEGGKKIVPTTDLIKTIAGL